MSRTFIFNWEKKGYKPIMRENKIMAYNEKDAISYFKRVFGNLSVNKVNFIQECTKEGKIIGEPITDLKELM